MKILKRLCCLLLVLVCLSTTALPVLSAQDSSLTIHYEQNSIPLVNAPFYLYLVAWENEEGQFTVSEDFSKYNINITDDVTTWPSLASTLAAYAVFGQITPVKQGRTDADGLLHFSGLSHGVYLVTSSLHVQDDIAYTAEPALVVLTGKHINIFPKAEWVPDGGGDETDDETIKVLKVWEDGNKADRPTDVTVHLLKDGKIIDTVTLNATNRWRHTWSDLPAGYEYTVVEENVDGYTVTVQRQGITYVVTNTATDPSDGEEPPERPDLIPETGQPWAYVLMLTAAGLLFLVIGLFIRRGDEHEA